MSPPTDGAKVSSLLEQRVQHRQAEEQLAVDGRALGAPLEGVLVHRPPRRLQVSAQPLWRLVPEGTAQDSRV